MSKIIGYSIAVLGLIVIALSRQIASLSFLAKIPKISPATIIAGIIITAVGVALALMNSKFSSSSDAKQSEEEVPIYEGKGKNRLCSFYTARCRPQENG